MEVVILWQMMISYLIKLLLFLEPTNGLPIDNELDREVLTDANGNHCIPCESIYNRFQPDNNTCVTNVKECGSCLQGSAQEEFANGEMSDQCFFNTETRDISGDESDLRLSVGLPVGLILVFATISLGFAFHYKKEILKTIHRLRERRTDIGSDKEMSDDDPQPEPKEDLVLMERSQTAVGELMGEAVANQTDGQPSANDQQVILNVDEENEQLIVGTGEFEVFYRKNQIDGA